VLFSYPKELSFILYAKRAITYIRSHCSENKDSTWRQEFLGCGSETLEQSIRLTAAAWHWIRTL